MKAIGYVRVSTEEQTNGVSLEAQEAKIRAWCTLHDAELVAIYRDEGISGYKGRDSRPGLDTALKQVCKVKGSLVVYSLSRLASACSGDIFGHEMEVPSSSLSPQERAGGEGLWSPAHPLKPPHPHPLPEGEGIRAHGQAGLLFLH
jgi:hypothetical protein